MCLKEKTREQKEAELIPKVQEAVNYGLQVLDSAFEQLDIKAGNSDSEDEEATDRVEPILEPKVHNPVLFCLWCVSHDKQAMTVLPHRYIRPLLAEGLWGVD